MMPRTELRWPIALLAVGALGLGLGLMAIDAAPVGVFADDAFYVILARAIATGEGFRFLNLPGAPAATHFPPGYPLVLSLLWRLAPRFPENVVVLKALNAACLAVVGAATARYVKRRLDAPVLAFVLGVATAASLPLLILGSMLLSELLFLALVMLLLPVLEELVDRPRSMLNAAVLGAAIAACALVRTHGVVLVAAVAAPLAYRRRWREAIALVAATILCLLPWQLWAARHGGTLPAPLLGQYDSYSRWWMQAYHALGPSVLTVTARKTSDATLTMFAVLFSPTRGVIAHALTLVLLATLGGIGANAIWRRMPVLLLFLAAYLLIVLLWPGEPARFLWGVWPLFLIPLGAGARAVLQSGWARPARLGLVAGATWLLVGYAMYEVRGFRGRWWSSIARGSAPRIAGAVTWTAANAAPTDIVAADDDGAVFLYTGRRTVPVRSFTAAQYLTGRSSTADEGIIPILDAYDVRHVVVGTAGSYDAAASLAAPPRPRLSAPREYPGGAAFTVLSR